MVLWKKKPDLKEIFVLKILLTRVVIKIRSALPEINSSTTISVQKHRYVFPRAICDLIDHKLCFVETD